MRRRIKQHKLTSAEASTTQTSCTRLPNLLGIKAAKIEKKKKRKKEEEPQYQTGHQRKEMCVFWVYVHLCERHLHPSGTVDETIDLGESHHTPALLREQGGVEGKWEK